MTTQVQVVYHEELGHWWAESPDLDSFVATGETLSEVRRLVREGLPFYLQTDDVELFEIREGGALLLDLQVHGVPPSGSSTATGSHVKVRPAGRLPLPA